MAFINTLNLTLSTLEPQTQVELMQKSMILVSRFVRYADTFDGNSQLYAYFFKEIYPSLRTNEKKLQAYSEILRFVFNKEPADPVRHFSRACPHPNYIKQRLPKFYKKENSLKLAQTELKEKKAFDFILLNLIQRERFLTVFKNYSSSEVYEYMKSSDNDCQALYDKVLIEESLRSFTGTSNDPLNKKPGKSIQKI